MLKLQKSIVESRYLTLKLSHFWSNMAEYSIIAFFFFSVWINTFCFGTLIFCLTWCETCNNVFVFSVQSVASVTREFFCKAFNICTTRLGDVDWRSHCLLCDFNWFGKAVWMHNAVLKEAKLRNILHSKFTKIQANYCCKNKKNPFPVLFLSCNGLTWL